LAGTGGGGGDMTGTSGTGGGGSGAGGNASGGDININGMTGVRSRVIGGDVAVFPAGAGSMLGMATSSTTVNQSGPAATGYGTGGAGGNAEDSATDRAGADGTGGVIIVTEFY